MPAGITYTLTNLEDDIKKANAEADLFSLETRCWLDSFVFFVGLMFHVVGHVSKFVIMSNLFPKNC